MPRTIASMNRAPAELNLGGVAVTEKVFQTTGGLAVILPIPMGLVSPTIGSGRQAARVKIFAGGRVTGGGTANFTPQLQFGTSLTPGSNVDIESGAAVAVNSTAGVAWLIDCDLVILTGVAAGAGKIDGYTFNAVMGSTRTFATSAIADTAVSTYNPALETAIQGFVVTGTFSAGFATNAAYLDWFVMEGIGV